MSVDKNPPKEDSEESMGSSPEGEAPAAPPQQQAENQQPKRKGGRKPVRQQEHCGQGRCPALSPWLASGQSQGSSSHPVIIPIAHGLGPYACAYANVIDRSTRRLRRGSKETAKHKRPSVSAGPSTSSSSRRPSELMNRTWPTSRLPIDMPPMSVSCCVTRTRY